MFDYIIIPFLVHMTTYWSLSLLFYYIDLKYLDKNHNNWNKYGDAAKCSLINMVTISLPILYFTENYTIAAINRSVNDSYYMILFKVFIIGNMSNLLFYIFHRLLHTKLLFNTIHYKHHEFIEPIAVASLYAHPVEHIFANTLSFLIPFHIVGVPYITMLILLFFGTVTVIFSHIKYKTIYGNDHAIHHRLFKYNFGFASYLDKMLSTYKTI